VEKVPGGELEHSRVLKGVMINKDVTHPKACYPYQTLLASSHPPSPLYQSHHYSVRLTSSSQGVNPPSSLPRLRFLSAQSPGHGYRRRVTGRGKTYPRPVHIETPWGTGARMWLAWRGRDGGTEGRRLWAMYLAFGHTKQRDTTSLG
jgi:hypothetical protein